MLTLRQRRLKASWLFLGVGLALVWSYLFLPSSGLAKPLAMAGSSAVCAIAVAVGIKTNRPTRRLAWCLLLLGQVCQVAADVSWRVIPEIQHTTVGFPNVSDVFFVLGYGAYLAGLAVLIRSRTARDRANLLDATVVTLGVALLSWVFMIAPAIHDTTVSLAAQAFSIVYPLVDLLMLATLVRVGFGSSKSTTASRLLMAGVALALAGDLTFSLVANYALGTFVDCIWMSIYAVLGAAALHPSMAEEIRADHAPLTTVSRTRITLLAVAALMAPAALVLQELISDDTDVVVIAGVGSVMFLLILGRMEGLVSHLRRAESDRRLLLERVIRAAEDERERIASELHDAPIQRLAGVNFRLATVLQRFKRGATTEAEILLQSVQEELSAEIEGLRRMMSGLRPPSLDHSGLEGALSDEASEFRKLTGMGCKVSVRPHRPLPRDLETAMFRIAKEALRNTAAHSRGTNCSIDVYEDADAVHLVIADDGVGFIVGGKVAAFGLASMRQYVEMNQGQLDMTAAPGQGTVLHARFTHIRKAA